MAIFTSYVKLPEGICKMKYPHEVGWCIDPKKLIGKLCKVKPSSYELVFLKHR